MVRFHISHSFPMALPITAPCTAQLHSDVPWGVPLLENSISVAPEFQSHSLGCVSTPPVRLHHCSPNPLAACKRERTSWAKSLRTAGWGAGAEQEGETTGQTAGEGKEEEWDHRNSNNNSESHLETTAGSWVQAQAWAGLPKPRPFIIQCLKCGEYGIMPLLEGAAKHSGDWCTEQKFNSFSQFFWQSDDSRAVLDADSWHCSVALKPLTPGEGTLHSPNPCGEYLGLFSQQWNTPRSKEQFRGSSKCTAILQNNWKINRKSLFMAHSKLTLCKLDTKARDSRVTPVQGVKFHQTSSHG